MRTVIFPCVFILFLYPLLGSCDRKTCCDDPPENTSFNPPTREDFQRLQQQFTDSLAETFVFNTNEGLYATSAKGTQIRVYPNCVNTVDGTSVDGEVSLKFLQYYDRRTTLLASIPSWARTNTDITALLNIGAFFSVHLYQGDSELFSNCEMLITIPFSLLPETDRELNLWNGDEIYQGTAPWLPLDGGLLVEADNYITSFLYGKWRAISKNVELSETTNDIRVLVSEGYNSDNARVYIAYPNDNNGLAQLHYDRETGMFHSPYPLPDIPQAYLIFLSEDDGQWRYGIKEITVTENTTYTLAHSETQRASSETLISVINDLP
ncbi:hypothetical protein [Sinomicrobium sp.]